MRMYKNIDEMLEFLSPMLVKSDNWSYYIILYYIILYYIILYYIINHVDYSILACK